MKFGKNLTFVHPRKRVKLEPHFRIAVKDIGDHRLTDGFWDRSEAATIASVTTKTLSVEDHFLHFCIHNVEHSFSLMNHLVDLHLMLAQFEDSLDWQYIFSTARKWGHLNSVVLNLDLIENLLGSNISSASKFIAEDRFRRKACLATSQAVVEEKHNQWHYNFNTLIKVIMIKSWKMKFRFLRYREKELFSIQHKGDRITFRSTIFRYGLILKRYLPMVFLPVVRPRQFILWIRTRIWLST